MLQGLLHVDTVIRVVNQHLFKQVDGVGVGTLEQHLKVFALAFWQLADKVSVLFVLNFLDKLAGSRGFLMMSSARMQPTDQTSIFESYFFQERITSGALYHLVAM